jgi:hypothetical protein
MANTTTPAEARRRLARSVHKSETKLARVRRAVSLADELGDPDVLAELLEDGDINI